MNAQAENKPVGSEPVNPYREEVDANGQRWRVGPDGSKLKIGGTIGPGAPKKEIRAKALKLSEDYLKRAAKVLNDPERSDDDPTVLKYGEAALRYGLGTSDEVEIANERQTLEAMARALQGEVDSDTAMRIAAKFADHLGLK